MKKLFLLLLLFQASIFVTAQNSFHCVVRDSISKEELPGVAVILFGTQQGIITNANGKADLQNIPDGLQTLSFSLMGYRTKKYVQKFPLQHSEQIFEILLSEEHQELDEVIVSTTRTNSRIDDLATKIEVLGQEDMDEESTIVPGSVTSILGDLSIITIQKTNPVNGNEGIRMQGLDPRYTQIMRDGLPLYGGFSGSLGVLSIPPLDLKQVEIIKGSAATLYGGGAISGLINFISKTPGDSLLTTLTLNVTSLKETNLNLFSSAKSKRAGYTLFAGINTKTAVDVNKDGFTEVPHDQNVTLHPRFFYEWNKKSKLIVGLCSTFDARESGDIQAVRYSSDSIHRFLEKEKTSRNTVDLNFNAELNSTNTFTVKAAVSRFQRSSDFSGFKFNGLQYATYAEMSDVISLHKNTLVAGINLSSEAFKKQKSDSVLFGNYVNITPGIFLQDDWLLLDKLTLQAGLRYDLNSSYGNFLLPRLSLFYKAGPKLSLRLAAGTGYKAPNLFDFSDPNQKLSALSSSIKPEKSYGSNADINFHTWLFDKLSVQIDEAIYYTHITNPTELIQNTAGYTSLVNGDYGVNSYGTDTYLRLKYEEIELYLGYNHTESIKQNSKQTWNMPFNPKDKLSATLAYEIESRWRMGVESSYTANQYIYNNQKVPNFWFMAAMLERKFKQGSIVLNAENLLDQRQAKHESLVNGPISNPVFKPVWGPLEGRVINLSVKLNI